MKNSKFKITQKLGIAVAITLFFKIVFFRIEDFFEWDLVFITAIVLIIWQGNEAIDGFLNTRHPWIENAKKRLIVQSFLSVIFTSITLFTLMYTLHQLRFGDGRIIDRKMMEIFPPAILFTLALLSIKIGTEFFNALKNSLLEVEKYKTESANAQLENLKNQLNPHFLFNNLSVLTSLVYKNQDKAAHFINELSKVYRYVLDNKNSELVPLKEELDFINHYIYLRKIRFEESILFEIKIEESKKNDFLLPMCLQMLVENTIQHNETSQANPLKVLIYTENNSLIIENPILPRSNVADSTKTGLKNIEKRYSFFTDDKVIISNNGKIFKVILPLIQRR
ncbi:sensor histidine kinase [Flavobacterium sp. IMCC34518]|uniref:sensor histidine kinase n=1 Tax=Flavobacterium sp. IMCC34518 TaxID=3003623 RepID=UPI0022AC2A4A|nr:sensor histidine kinase [Flavobacterium sp. IMCC34518]